MVASCSLGWGIQKRSRIWNWTVPTCNWWAINLYSNPCWFMPNFPLWNLFGVFHMCLTSPLSLHGSRQKHPKDYISRVLRFWALFWTLIVACRCIDWHKESSSLADVSKTHLATRNFHGRTEVVHTCTSKVSHRDWYAQTGDLRPHAGPGAHFVPNIWVHEELLWNPCHKPVNGTPCSWPNHTPDHQLRLLVALTKAGFQQSFLSRIPHFWPWFWGWSD